MGHGADSSWDVERRRLESTYVDAMKGVDAAYRAADYSRVVDRAFRASEAGLRLRLGVSSRVPRDQLVNDAFDPGSHSPTRIVLPAPAATRRAFGDLVRGAYVYYASPGVAGRFDRDDAPEAVLIALIIDRQVAAAGEPIVLSEVPPKRSRKARGGFVSKLVGLPFDVDVEVELGSGNQAVGPPPSFERPEFAPVLDARDRGDYTKAADLAFEVVDGSLRRVTGSRARDPDRLVASAFRSSKPVGALVNGAAPSSVQHAQWMLVRALSTLFRRPSGLAPPHDYSPEQESLLVAAILHRMVESAAHRPRPGMP